MKTMRISDNVVLSLFARQIGFFMHFPRTTRSLILVLVPATYMACGIEDDGSPQQEDAYVEPYREAVYDLLAEDDPNQTCCYIQVMRYYAESEPGGRRACNVDPHSGPTIPCSIPDEWELKMVNGCPVFELRPGGSTCIPPSGD